MIKSGHLLKDKLAISFYFLLWPLRRILLYNFPLIREVVVENSDGVFYCGKDFSAVGCVHPSYEEELRPIFDSIKDGISIDIGANVGKYSIILGKNGGKKGKIIAIEPEKKNFEMLKYNIRLNGLKNIIVINRACSSKSEKRKFFLSENGIGTHSLYKTQKNKIFLTEKFIEINTIKLDDLIFKDLRKKIDKKISFIKIDVEGAEAEVLNGAKETLKKFHPKILVEAWDEEALKKIEKILFPFGYEKIMVNSENYLFIRDS